MPVPTLHAGNTKIAIDRGDITVEKVDAIVNAANAGLRGGGGVDGAIHRAGGPSIMAECRKIGRCPTGQAVITAGGNLFARYVIHAVGPIHTGLRTDAAELASCYRNSLDRAAEVEARTIAFPSISTGAYGYPIRDAAPIAIDTISKYAEAKPDQFDLIRLILFNDADYSVYFAEFSRRGATRE